MFQNQIFQVKCFNLETFEIFQTCPAGPSYRGFARYAHGTYYFQFIFFVCGSMGLLKLVRVRNQNSELNLDFLKFDYLFLFVDFP